MRLLLRGLVYFHQLRGLAGGQAACTSLSSLLGSDIAQSSGSDYDASVAEPINLANNVQKPACIVYPQTTQDVSLAMTAIFQAQSRYAVLAGGHSAMKGWNNVQDGVLIHFRDMTEASYDSNSDTITLEPGIRWGDAVETLAPFGVAPVSGRAEHVGTGYLLGGGISFLSPSQGWAADSYKELDVVLVDGTVVTATKDNQYKDLFKALKGGANRFGIVTRYKLIPFHSGTADDRNWFGGFISYPPEAAEAVFRAAAHFARDVKDPKATIFVTLVDAVANGQINTLLQVSVYYNGPDLPRSVFGELLDIEGAEPSVSALSYADIIATAFPGQDDHGNTHVYGSTVIKGDNEDAIVAVRGHSLNLTQALANDFTFTAVTITPIPQSMIDVGKTRGGNAIDAPSGGYAVFQLQQVLSPGVVDVPESVQRGKQLLLQQAAPTPGYPLFINECDATQNVLSTYGQFNSLKETYAKYDPTRFNVRFTDGPIGL